MKMPESKPVCLNQISKITYTSKKLIVQTGYVPENFQMTWSTIQIKIRAWFFKTNDIVIVSLKFPTLISQNRQHFLLKKCEELKSFSHFFQPKNMRSFCAHFFQQNLSVYLVIML